MDSKFTNINNSAPVVDLLERNKKVVPRSKFNFSNTKILNANFGTIIPIDLIHTLPNEDYNIGYDILSLTRVPAVRRILSGCRLYVHTVYQPESNLWEGALNQKTGGRSGNIDLKKPTLIYKSDTLPNKNFSYDCRTPNSLCDLLGLPITVYDYNHPLTSYVPAMSYSETLENLNADYNVEVDALPFFMYQRLCRDMFFNSNLLYNNKNWYPDNEYHFILPYDCGALNLFNYDYNADDPSTFLFTGFSTNMRSSVIANSNIFVPNNSNSPVFLPALHYRQFRGDIFTSSLPFPDLIRGDAPILDMQSIRALDVDDFVVPKAYTGTITNNTSTNAQQMFPEYVNYTADVNPDSDTSSGIRTFFSSIQYHGGSLSTSELLKRSYGINMQEIASRLISNNISLSDLRSLMVYTLIKQKNALTGGDYNDLVKAHFGVSPKMRNFQHTYIGGFYADFVFNEVFQTSESETTPLGTTASRGVTAQSGYVGKFHSDDYGYIMTVLEIVPETFYHQGISKNLTKLTREDVYLPETNELSPQAILNQEIFASSDEAYNQDVFGYTERNIEYKFRNNEVHGLSACGSASEYDNALLQKRTFSSKVYLNNDFVTLSPKNVDMSIMSSTDEPPFDIVVKSRIEKVSPIPYVSIPGGLDLSLV